MEIIAKAGNEEVAYVYVGEFENEKMVEFVESIQPPIPREEKWVLIVSTLFGCPVGCMMCDAGEEFKGILTEEQILKQIDFLIRKRYPDGKVPIPKFKIQFARMGEPAYNANVLSVLRKLPIIYDIPGFMPSISTIAPNNTSSFFEELLEIKEQLYSNGKFQLQFSIHTTDELFRDEIIPTKKWSFAKIADYGKRFYQTGDRKITLNFALAKDTPFDPEVLIKYFDPSIFLIKITPINPTYSAQENELETHFTSEKDKEDPLIHSLKSYGYDVILSIGELEENQIGSNCGQYIKKHLDEREQKIKAYSYPIQKINND
jgi:23S rRNA (adenine2503-C2)-methyltransferase